MVRDFQLAIRTLRRTPVLLGLTLGTVSALALTPVLNGLLYDIPARDVRTFLIVPGGLAAAAFIAMILPAFRAARVDPIVVIRD